MRFVEFKTDYTYAGTAYQKGDRAYMCEADFQQLWYESVVMCLDNLSSSMDAPERNKMMAKPRGKK